MIDERDEEARRKSEEAINNKKNRGSKYCTSSSEVSVKTVIYRGGSKNIVSAGGEKKQQGNEEGKIGVLIPSSPSSNGSYNLPLHRKISSNSSKGDSPTFHHRQTFKFMNELRSSHEKSSSTLQPVIKSSPCGRKCLQNQQQKVMCDIPSYHPLTNHPNPHQYHHYVYHQHNGKNLEELHNFSSTSSRKHLYLDCIKRNDLKLNTDSYLVRRRRRKVERKDDRGGNGDGEEEVEEVAFQDFDRIYRSIDRNLSCSVRRRRNRRRSRSWRERAKSNELWVDGPLCRDNSYSNEPSTSVAGKKKKEQPHNLSSQDRRKILDVEYLEKHERIQDWIQQHTKQIWSDILTTPSATSPSSSSLTHRTRLLQSNHDFSPQNQSPEAKQVSLDGINDVTLFSPTYFEKGKGEIIDEIDGKRIFGPSSNISFHTIDTKPLKDDQPNHDHKSQIHETFHSLSNDNCFYGSDIRRSIDPGHETDPGHLMSESEAEEDRDRDAISECYCWDRGSPSLFGDEEIRSELSTEPLGMLKLEQFLKKLIEVTAPITEDLKEKDSKNREVKCNGEVEEKSDVSSSNNFSSEVSDTGRVESSRNKSNRNCDQLLPVTTLSVLNNAEALEELQKAVQVGFNGPQLPTSPRVNRLIATGGNNGPLFPASSLSPVHSSKKQSAATLSRCSSSEGRQNRQKGMQQKRNTTSTTTSGHGTTSEGESNSSGAKETSSKGSSVQTPSPVTKSKPASSGYDSTINDDESDHRTMHQVRKNHTNQTVSIVPNNNESMVKLRDKDSKSIMKRQRKKRDAAITIGTVGSNDPKRESVSSETSSIVCCKFFC